MKKVKTILIILITMSGVFSAAACSTAGEPTESSGSLAETKAVETTVAETTLRYDPENTNVCPKCGSADLAVIEYGYPAPSQSEETNRKIRNGDIVLGGCVVDSSSPQHLCKRCGYDF